MINYTQLLITIFVVFIMMCANNCCYKSKTEHMSEINDEAISMIASLYNGKKLVVNELEVLGSLNVGKAATIGPAYIGGYGGNIDDMGHAQFSHKDHKNESNFALLQRRDGMTWLNCKKDSQVNIENGRGSKAVALSNGMTMHGTTTVNGTTTVSGTLNAADVTAKNWFKGYGLMASGPVNAASVKMQNWKLGVNTGHLVFQSDHNKRELINPTNLSKHHRGVGVAGGNTYVI